jgi:putative transcriptional regulator
MANKTTKPNARLDAALLEMARDYRGTLLRPATADKITLRVLGENAPPRPGRLKPEAIRALREKAGMSQAVFARCLNLTPGYVSQIERGTKRPTGAALALLHVIRRKGMTAIL